MKLFPSRDIEVRDAAFWRAYNRKRDHYIAQLQRELAAQEVHVATLWDAVNHRAQVNKDLAARLEQAQQTIRDLETTLGLTGFPESLNRPPLETCEGPFRVTVVPLRAPSAGPSEWRSNPPSLAGRWRTSGRWHRLEDCNRA